MTTAPEVVGEPAIEELQRAPAARGRRRWVSFGREAALITCAAVLYSLVRGLTDDRTRLAFANAERVVSFERALGIFVEPQLQGAALGSEVMVNAVNAIYLAYWPVTIGGLGWLLIRHPSRYPLYRAAVLASGAISLLVFAVFPLAPPRFLPDHGFVDTIALRSDGYREATASALVNEYAAMPSLHLGWVLLLSIAVGTITRRRVLRVAAASLPVLMFAAIVLTANHYLVDGAAGGAVVLVGLAIATALRSWRRMGARRSCPGRSAVCDRSHRHGAPLRPVAEPRHRPEAVRGHTPAVVSDGG